MYYQLTSSQTVSGKVLLEQTIALDLRAKNITDEAIVDYVSREELEETIFYTNCCSVLMMNKRGYFNNTFKGVFLCNGSS